VFDGLDEPFADSSAIPTWLVSRETRRHVTVALSGDGADEVFGGYRKYHGELHAGAYHRIPRVLRRFVAHAGGDAVARQDGWMRTMTGDEVGALTGSGRRDDIEGLAATSRDAADADDPINAMLFADTRIGLPGDMLVKVDRMSMAHGLEVRCPMLDRRVVAAAFAMPGHYKLQRGRGKAVLRDAFAGMLPTEVFARPKRGFEIPIAQWLTGPLRAMTEAAIDPAWLRGIGLEATDLPARWRADLDARRRDTSEKLWTLIAFQAWCEREATEGYGAAG
jgi:asparagine synthase (glutamine-hydrolysing)